MTQALTLVAHKAHTDVPALLRGVIVTACALALILAGEALPF